MAAVNDTFIAGRKFERAELQDSLASKRAELIAVHGRRRVGKTYLIRAVFREHICFELTGMRDATLKHQLANFTRAMSALVSYSLAPPATWVDAFDVLKRFLTEELANGDRKVVFLDELPWLATARSGFLSALDYFWNTFGSRQQNLLVVICGSAASWMIVNVLHHKGGLHNRVTRTIALKPFNLHETEAFLIGRGILLDRHQILELFMAVGGIPFYLDYSRKGKSAAQLIDTMFFAQNAPLRDEFSQLYSALFDHHEHHVKVIQALGKRRSGLTRSEIIAGTGLLTGGRLTTTLAELESTGFVLRTVPFGKTARESVYRLIDAFTLFHLRWGSARVNASDGAGWWLHRRSTPSGISWSGYAFENVCLSHVRQIKHALGISGILTEQSAWQHRAMGRDQSGAQIDLIIDRPDGVVNLCEMKYSNARFIIDKKYAKTLRERSAIFRSVTKTRKSIFITFVTVHGVATGPYKSELIANDIDSDALFAS